MNDSNQFQTTYLYYPNGQIKQEQNFRNGAAHGRALFWHENGALAEKGEFRNGLKEGLWQWWSIQGHRIKEGYFIAGKLHDNIEFEREVG